MKKVVRHLLIASILFFFSGNSIAQTACGWQQGDFITYTQANLDIFPDPQLIFTQPNYNTVYGSNGGVVEIGIPGASGFSMQFTGIDAGVRGYLVTGGSPSSLTADLINPTSSPSGTFGGDLLVLTLTIDFSDAGFMNGNANIPYGDLVLTNFQNNLSSLNGLTVRQFNSLANILLGGGSNGYTISDIAPITAQLTAAFSDAPAPPTQFALDHLKRVWQQGDYITRTQDQWDATTNWYTAYNQIYASTFGTVQIGLDPSLGYRIRFSDGSRVSDYLTQSGTPAALTQDLDDPTSSSSAQFGAEILALTMNIDWSDAGETPNVNGIHFGDLILQNMTANPELNGLSVREVMDIANTLLGGGTSFISIAAINDVVGD